VKGRRDKVKDSGAPVLLRPPVVAARVQTEPARPATPSPAGPDRDLYLFVQALHQASKNGSRGEIRAAIEMQLVRPEMWETLKTRYAAAGMPFRNDVVRLVDDLLDVSTQESFDAARVGDALQRVVYPFALGE
jgi:hypothetical protein